MEQKSTERFRMEICPVLLRVGRGIRTLDLQNHNLTR